MAFLPLNGHQQKPFCQRICDAWEPPTKVGRPQYCRLGVHSTVSSGRRAAHWLSSKMATPLPPAPNIHRATDPGSPGSGLELTARACLQIRYPPLQNLQAGRRASSTVHYAPTIHVLVTDCTLHVVTPMVVATGHRRMFGPCQEPEKLQTAKGKRKVERKRWDLKLFAGAALPFCTWCRMGTREDVCWFVARSSERRGWGEGNISSTWPPCITFWVVGAVFWWI